MRGTVFFKTLQDHLWQVFWYGVGLALLAALVVYVYPSYNDQMAEFEIPEALEGFLGDADFATPEGFLSAEFFSYAPALLVIFAIMAGTSALGGEEASGTLELLMAQPVSRARVAVEKLVGLFVSICFIAMLIYCGWLISVPFVEIDISYLKLASATAQIVPLVMFFSALSVWAAAALGRKLATGVVTAVAVASYFVEYLANIVDVLKPLQWISVFHYHDGVNALGGDFEPWRLLVLIAATAIAAAMAVKAFENREIGAQDEITVGALRRILGGRAP